ncbi:MAG TPA: PAS domain-containing protein [Gemmatimonas sp.]|uniref:PAS domain-containing hybrid sensor histidine kinase/response regulator n=1 Tax=Gemmatimonas sp. TaxID=1962908 RepID=UPI002ED90EAE
MRRPLRMRAVHGPQRPFWWGCFAVLASVSLCIGVLWLHVLQTRVVTRSETILSSVREARADLSQGFLHVMLADSTGIPFQREQGLALLHQAVEALRRPLTGKERASGSGEATAPMAALDRQARSFLVQLSMWDKATGAERGKFEGRIREAFHELELMAEELDRGQRMQLAAASQQLDRRFDVAVVVAAMLSIVLYVGVVTSHRHQLQTARALDENVNEHLRMEGAVQSAEQRFRELAEAIEEVFWMTDVAKQQMLYVSPAYERIWGRSQADLYAAPESWVEHIHADDRERVMQAAREQQVAGTYDETYRIVRADGAIRWIRDRAFPVAGPDGTVERVVGTAQDVTEQRILEDQFRQAQKMEAVGQLAGGVAHDFNNILAAMIIQVELALTTDGAPEEVRRDLVEIGQSVDRAKSLTRQLLAFSRRQMMRVEDVDLNQVVKGFSGLLDRLLGETVALTVELAPGSLVATADVGMLEQILMNLAVNAKDAMPRGGTLVIRTFTRDVSETEPGARGGGERVTHVGFSVTDTGTGIAPDHLSRIFEPFFTTKPVGEGTGLGLASVFGIVSQHHGVVEVQSALGQGTTFTVSLPMSGRTASEQAEATPAREVFRAHETILVAEDDPSVRSLLQLVLEQQGYQVLVAMNGAEALDVVRRHCGPIHLLLSDIVMPGAIDGFELCQELRTLHPGMRRLFMSGYGSEIGAQMLALEAGEEVLTKPFTTAELLEALRAELDGVGARGTVNGIRRLAHSS